MSFLQRLQILEHSPQRLILREQPLLEWLFVLALFNAGLMALSVGAWLTTVASWVAAAMLLLMARTRRIVFDDDTGMLSIRLVMLWGQRTVNTMPLAALRGAYLHEDEAGSQVILIENEVEHGLSAHTRGGFDWKADVVEAINGFLG